MVRQEQPECTRRHSCCQDGEEEGEKRSTENKDVPLMWRRITLCFTAPAAKL